MKVILAGYSKTGTKSIAAALRQLGYQVYDFMDHFWYHYDDWIKIMQKGASTEDFQRMYKDVDALTGAPIYIFWEEIHKAFPDAKIILSVRDEDEWYQSYTGHGDKLRAYYKYPMTQILTPTGRKYFKFYRGLVRLNFGADMCSPFDFSHHNSESMIRMRYRQNNMYCAQRAPKDKLLVYNVKEGWEPLCAFLGKEVPREPFPHRNIGAVFIEDLKDVHPAMNRIELEWKIVISILIGVGIYTSYKTYRSGCLWNAANFFSSSFQGRFSFV
ncbi:uncharacterized protein LOC143450517 [Clavelina lepadiformis]|uniref:uncharacterized protein LOC143450517 n=1 Tax=Clavelina lepadiformis TaxID=159417 RepID=UPI004041C9D8